MTPIATRLTRIFLVIAEKTIPVSKIIGISLNIRHQRDVLVKVLDFICLINRASMCWYAKTKLTVLLLNETMGEQMR